MPSSSKKQHNFMAAVAHSKSFAKKVGVPQSVGKDFTEADKGRKMSGSKYVLGTLKGTGAGAGETKGDSTRGNKKLEQMMGKIKSARDGYSSRGAGSIKRYAPGGKVSGPKNPYETRSQAMAAKKAGSGIDNLVGRARAAGLSPGTREFSEFIGSGGESNTRDSIIAEGRAKGVKFDKYGRVKAPSSATSDMLKKGAKFALDASPFGGIRKAGESVKKLLTTKTTKRPESIGKGGNAVKRYNGEEGSVVSSDEAEGSEQSKKNIADAKVAKSKAEDAKGKLNLGTKRGFFSSLFSGKIKEYNAEHKRNRDLQSMFGKGFKSAATIDAENKRAALDKPKITIDFNPSELQTGPDMEAHKQANREARQMRKRMKREERQRQSQSQEAPKQEESKGESFGAWFKKQKEGTVQTWTNPKTGEKKRILISRTKPAASTSSAPAKKDDSKGITESSKNDFISRIATNLTKKETATSSTPTKKSGWQTSNENFLKGQAAQRAAADSWVRIQKAKEDAAKKKKEAQKANFKPSSNKAYNYCGGGMTKAYKKGGLVSSRADGIASRGRTRCKIV